MQQIKKEDYYEEETSDVYMDEYPNSDVYYGKEDLEWCLWCNYTVEYDYYKLFGLSLYTSTGYLMYDYKLLDDWVSFCMKNGYNFNRMIPMNLWRLAVDE